MTRNPEESKLEGEIGELAQALVSSRGMVEGYLYKTSQSQGFFTVELFHKRYYKLSLF